MKNRLFISSLLIICFSFSLFSQTSTKKVLSHEDYDSWKKLDHPEISANGEWISYEVNPQKGDGFLYLVNTTSMKKDSFARGYDAEFSPNSDFVIFKIKPQEDSTRKAKLLKKKKENLPKDSVAIWILKNQSIIKTASLKSFVVPKENTSWYAFLYEKKEIADTVSKNKKDTTLSKTEKKKEPKKKKSKLSDVEVFDMMYGNPITSHVFQTKEVTECVFSKSGKYFGFITLKKDTIDTTGVYIFDVSKEKLTCLFQKKGLAKKLVLDETGNQLSFIYTGDTAKVKHFSLYYCDVQKQVPIMVVDSLTNGMKKNWEISENATIYFSQDGTKLFLGTAPILRPEPKDTLLDEEKVKLDLWNWKDELIQTEQLKNLEKDRKKYFSAIYHIQPKIFVQIADSLMDEVRYIQKGNGPVALGISYKPYLKLSYREDIDYQDIYIVDVLTGERKLVLTKKAFGAGLSPSGNYLLWFEAGDSTWYTLNLRTNKTTALTKSLKVKFFNEENNVPRIPSSYGIAGWTENDREVLIYDRYDIWKINPENKVAPLNLTNGRESKTIFRYVRLDEEALFIKPKEKLMLKSKNGETAKQGFYKLESISSYKPEKLIMWDNNITYPLKSKKADKLIWQKSSYTEYPDLWMSDMIFNNIYKISDVNPEQKNFLWGTVELVKWKTPSGVESKGLLYKPENFDPNKKYPMIVYFYEKNSDNIYNHIVPAPSRSVINFPLYNSNGYVIFVPDIDYKVGYPGDCAVDAVVSGTQAMIDKGFIDKDNIGLQGQSWGGYQVAYIVTQTSIFKAAMAGAPVANMTSAYSGIRWESGISRMFLYEHGQSRIGGTLWEKKDLYLINSPLFQADKITTPLLIMSNDNDGAVPWQQGIELFSALRRMDKPVWLLNYNGDEHNLIKRPNRMDLSIRMLQFFDHYLKGAPVPEWMNEGIPSIDKGIKNG